MQILVTNDDGVHAPGLIRLAAALRTVAEVVVVAPDRERSAVSHALTLHAPLRAKELQPAVFAIDGTPTDCVNLGIHGLLGARPALVVSGINRGSNMGDDITYSGTVAAAMEATLMGVPALAISLDVGHDQEADYAPAAALAARLAHQVLDRGLPGDTLLNVNVPCGALHGVRFTRQGKRRYADLVVEKLDPRGRKYYWLGAGDLGFVDEDGTDCHAVQHGLVSITPLHLDLTNYRAFRELASWDVDAFVCGSSSVDLP